MVTTYRIWSVSALPGHHNGRGWTLQRGDCSGHDWGGSDPPKCSGVWLYVLQILSEYCILVTLLAFFWTLVDGLSSIEGRKNDIWRKVYRMVQVANGDLSFVHWSRPSFSIGLSELIFIFSGITPWQGAAHQDERSISYTFDGSTGGTMSCGSILWSSTLQIPSDCGSRSKSPGLRMPHREWCLQGAIFEQR